MKYILNCFIDLVKKTVGISRFRRIEHYGYFNYLFIIVCPRDMYIK